ncbi:uncharacterized protein B0T15DRAFT_540980 [Chaetomium strumarium]|uniref:Transferase-like protein n=1 Tax=Chaetomium strumarium TaxID=1170767 RepID=A0AAJ0GPT0_9PEZI|nr:hypothetical protein B0T15DRAFT_540980 [Chaetomium strumarium]
MEVIPISALDNVGAFRNTRVRTFFLLDDRLDEVKLRDALTGLIRDHWRKLGARIVMGKNKRRPVYHVPKVFDDNYELFRWSVDHSASPIDEAAPELQLKTAKPEGGVAVLPSVEVFDARFRPQHWPISLDAEPDAPLLLVHLSLFADATVISTSHPHILGDQLGLANILKAWLGLLEHKAPPPMVGYNEDILPGQKPFAEYPKSETFKKGRHRVRGPFERLFILPGYIWEMILEPKEEKATVFFPLPVLQSLRERYTAGLSEKDGASAELTNGDIISAIMTKLVRLYSNKKPTLSLTQTINLRGRIPALSTPQAQAGYLHNGLIYATSRFRYDPAMPASEIARLNRAAVADVLGDEDTIDVLCAVSREQHRRDQPLHICEPWERSYHITNWAPAWRDLDFGPALAEDAREARQGRRVGLVVHGDGQVPGVPARYVSFITSKSEDGYWVSFGTTIRGMEAVRKYLAEDPMLERF